MDSNGRIWKIKAYPEVTDTQHWIVILERSGNKLKTAEGVMKKSRKPKTRFPGFLNYSGVEALLLTMTMLTSERIMSSDHTGMLSAAVSAVFGELFSEKETVFEEEILF
jgi:hypothetical protein